MVWRLQAWRQRAEIALARRFGLTSREDRAFLVLVPVVGVVAGFLGVAVHYLIDLVRGLLWQQDAGLAEAAAARGWWVVAVLALGGLVVGILTLLSRESLSGGGMSVLIEAVALGQGRVPARPVLLRAAGAVATVGSGGSLGREGPMIRLGAMLASWLGERFGLPPHRVKVLVACGAAAGLAAAYNIPVGSTLFAMEVILGNFALEIFGPIVVSSVLATVITRSLEGGAALYASPGYQLGHPGELVAYALLGVVGAVLSLLFIWATRSGARIFSALSWVPLAARPLLGMTLVGALAVAYPQVLGGGVETINQALQGDLSLRLLLVLAVAKLVATALTAGCGGAGGLFTPSLCIGALVGGAYGSVVHGLTPTLAPSYGAYAIVGMAAVAAGTSHAPISIILILFEFTGEYELILPIMIAAIVAGLLARKLNPYSIYTEPLERRGIDLSWRMEEAVLAGLKASDLKRQDRNLLRPEDNYKSVVERFLGTRRQRLFVVDREQKFLGGVSLHDIKHALDDPESLSAVVAHDLMVPITTVIEPDMRLHEAVEAFARSSFERLPVVDPESGRYCGHLSKRDVMAVYAQEVLGRPARLATFTHGDASQTGRDYVELPPDFSIRLLPVPPNLVGRTLAELRLPQELGARVIQIRRRSQAGQELLIPDGATVFAAGDELITLGPQSALEQLARGGA